MVLVDCAMYLAGFILSAFIANAGCSESERRLVYDLIEGPGYNPLILPVKNISQAVQVQFGITLFQVISVDERTQIMKTNNWIRMTWNDYQLKWDPTRYDGIEAIRLPCQEVWKPDIVLLNNADGKYEQSYCCHTVIYSSGMVMWIPLAIYKSSCTIDVRYFPFDQQECEMKFGSWTFNSDEVQMGFLDNKELCYLDNYIYSGTWDLIGCPAKIVPESNKKYSEITYKIILRRKTLFFTVNLLAPCVLISFLSSLTFYLPANAQEKVTLCISILLALIVFLLLVSRSLPPTSVTIPLISKYLFFAFMLNIITIITSVMIININYSSPRTYKMSRWMRVVFLNWLPIILFMKRPKHNEKYEKWHKRKIAEKIAECDDKLKSQKPKLKNMSGQSSFSRSLDDGDVNYVFNTEALSSVRAQKTLESVEYITQHLRLKDDYEMICDDWKYVASVIDRFLLYTFIIVTVIGTITIIVDAPHIFEVIDQKTLVENLQIG